MATANILTNATIYLAAAVIMVPLAKRLGLGAVLGYLAAGIAIGPWVLRLITDPEAILHFSEFGVVLLLFLVGLELSPKRLWALRKPIFGMGGAQLLLSSMLIFAVFWLAGFDLKAAIVGGVALALSSTAMALQILEEKNLFSTKAGQNGFSILLFQDLAVIPIIALLPLFAISTVGEGETSGWMDAVKAVAVIAVLIVTGHFALRPVLRLIAKTELQEIFTAFALLLVIGIAVLMQMVGLSMALGTFIAGLLLADSEYRHALETVIDPLKGLLMGLFFIAVGMSVDFGLLIEKPVLIVSLVLILVVVKAAILFVMGRVAGIPVSQNSFFAFLLSQGGEFAFVVFSVATSHQVIGQSDADLMILVVALSMLTTPLLMIINDRVIEPRFAKSFSGVTEESFDEQDHPVIIAGFGRFGQIIGRFLHAHKIGVTLLDHDPDHIERIRMFGFTVFFGDATRLDLLQKAGADKSRLLVIAVDDKESANKIAHICRQHFPNLKIIARAWDMTHQFDFMDEGITQIYRETFESAMLAAESSMRMLGYADADIGKASQRFREHDDELIRCMHEIRDHGVEALASTSKELRDQLEALYEEEEHPIMPVNRN